MNRIQISLLRGRICMMQAQDIMTQDVATISGSATVADAVKLMKDEGLRALVVDRRNEQDPYGVLSETDIVYKVAAYGKNPNEIRVHQIMTQPCIVVNPELGVEYVAQLFAQAGVRIAPVIKGELLGIISISDIVRRSDFVEKPKHLFIQEAIEAAREEARRLCNQNGPTSGECAVAWDVVEELQATAADQRLVASL